MSSFQKLSLGETSYTLHRKQTNTWFFMDWYLWNWKMIGYIVFLTTKLRKVKYAVLDGLCPHHDMPGEVQLFIFAGRNRTSEHTFPSLLLDQRVRVQFNFFRHKLLYQSSKTINTDSNLKLEIHHQALGRKS